MGLIALPFAVDIAKVKSVFGAKNQELFEKIKTANFYDHYAHQSNDFLRYNFDRALEDIIFNYIKPEDRQVKSSFFGLKKSTSTSGLNENIALVYGYVLLVICDYLGTHLLPHCDGFYYGSDFEDAISIMKEKGLQLDLIDMFNQHDVFDIPKNNDFPGIKLFTKDEIKHINEVMDKVEIDEREIDFESEDFDEIQELLNNIRNCFGTCAERNVEMVTFTH